MEPKRCKMQIGRRGEAPFSGRGGEFTLSRKRKGFSVSMLNGEQWRLSIQPVRLGMVDLG